MRLDSDKVRWHRDRFGWTLDELAEEAGVAKGTLLRAEHGEDIQPRSGRRIAQAFGVETKDLVPDFPKAERRSSLEPSFNDVIEGRRLSRFADAIVAVAGRWGEAMADADMVDQKRLGLIAAALELNAVISERAEEEDWEAITNQERLEIVTAMEKLTEAGERGLARLKASHESRTQEEQIELRRRQIRDWTRRISA